MKINNRTMIDWYANTDFAVHVDMKIYKGIVLTMVKGEIQNISMKKKLNTKRSTEAELVTEILRQIIFFVDQEFTKVASIRLWFNIESRQ